MSVNGTLAEDKIRRVKSEYAPIYAHDGACAKLSTNSNETYKSAALTELFLALTELFPALAECFLALGRNSSYF